MAWRSTGNTNAQLIANLAKNSLITSERVKEAMLRTDRAHYAPHSPYTDAPQSIGFRATISAPHMHALAAEALLPFLGPDPNSTSNPNSSSTSDPSDAGSGSASAPGPRILDIGSGSGYLTEVLARLAGPRGSVVGVDHIEGLVQLARGNMAKGEEGRGMLAAGEGTEPDGKAGKERLAASVRFVCADGRRGWAQGAPYDAIHVGAAAEVAHEELVGQLRAPGRMFIPVVEGLEQYIYVIDKDESGKVHKKRDIMVRYVPLTDAPE